MAKRRNVLGRGLDALIPAADVSGSRELPLDMIIPGRSQPRMRFNQEKLAELAESIRLHGILQPLIVEPADENGKHRLIAGERRWQAAKLAGLMTAPVVEREAEPRVAVEVALVENIQRQDLDPLEEAAAFDRLVRDHGLTQDELATRVGRSRSAVANTLRLLSLPSAAREALIAGDISEGHARALLGIANSARRELVLRRVIADGLNVRQTEQLVAASRDRSPTTPTASTPVSPELRTLETQLRAALGTKVSVTKGPRAGRIVIEYYSDDDLQSLVERLLDGSESPSA